MQNKTEDWCFSVEPACRRCSGWCHPGARDSGKRRILAKEKSSGYCGYIMTYGLDLGRALLEDLLDAFLVFGGAEFVLEGDI